MLLAFTSAFCASAYGCAQVIGIEDTKVQQQAGAGGSGGAAGEPLGPEWACEKDTPPVPTKTSLTLTIHGFSLMSNPPMALEGLKIGVCPPFSTCDTAQNTTMTDAMGNATLTLPIDSTGFSGPLKFEAKGHATLLWYFAHPKTEDFSLTPLMIPTASVDGLVMSLGLTVDPTKGHITFSVTSCPAPDPDGGALVPTPQGNVAVAVDPKDPGSSVFYATPNNSFVSSATQPATLDNGHGAIWNLTPGSYKVVATPLGASMPAVQLPGVLVKSGIVSTIDLTAN
jgi:hypothetical protein